MTLFKTIKFRLTIWYLILFAILSSGLGAGIYLSLSSNLRANLDSELVARASQLSQFRDIMSIVAGGTFEEAQGEHISFHYYREGKLDSVSQRKPPFSINSDLVDRALSGETIFFDTQVQQKGLYRVYVSYFKPDNLKIDPGKFSSQRKKPENYPEKRRDNHRRKPKKRGRYDEKPPKRDRNNYNNAHPFYIETAALVITHPAGWIRTILSYLKAILLIAIPITLLFSGLGGFFLAGRALQPVKDITGNARQISENDLSRRIPIHSRDELGILSETINRMISRLENAFKRQKEFTSDASHELRAPLAVIQAEATLALRKQREADSYKKTIEVISNEADQMASLTNQLLDLARTDSGKKEVTLTQIDIAPFVAETCSEISVLCYEKQIRFDQKINKVPMINGDPSSLRRIFFNILTNAINYTEEGGKIIVVLRAEYNKVILSVTDSGIGIPKKELPYIFNRFYRVDKSRTREGKGSGLGLSICKQLVDLHNGQIIVKSSIGKGSRFEITFPALSV